MRTRDNCRSSSSLEGRRETYDATIEENGARNAREGRQQRAFAASSRQIGTQLGLHLVDHQVEKVLGESKERRVRRCPARRCLLRRLPRSRKDSPSRTGSDPVDCRT